jgi:WNK lysine deficient protein kinase
VDLVLPLEVHPDKPELVKLQLRLGDPKLRKDKHKDNEAIQFEFDLVKDNPEKISKELVSGKIRLNETTRSAIFAIVASFQRVFVDDCSR